MYEELNVYIYYFRVRGRDPIACCKMGRHAWKVGNQPLDGWCEGGLGHQRNDGGGCASIRERSERVESPGTYVTEWVSRGHFCWLCVLSDRPPVRLWLSPGEGWDAVTWWGWDKLWKWRNYWKSRRRCQVYGLRGVCWWLCVCYMTWHDYQYLVEGESHGILLWISMYNEQNKMNKWTDK